MTEYNFTENEKALIIGSVAFGTGAIGFLVPSFVAVAVVTIALSFATGKLLLRLNT